MAKRILIVVDEEAMAKWLPRHFEARGANVVQTADDEEALAHARTKPDIVILDLVLADRDGFALIQEIKSVAPDAFLICTSARAGTVARRKALAIGADTYLSKPFKLAELDLVVNGETKNDQAATAGRDYKGKRKGKRA